MPAGGGGDGDRTGRILVVVGDAAVERYQADFRIAVIVVLTATTSALADDAKNADKKKVAEAEAKRAAFQKKLIHIDPPGTYPAQPGRPARPRERPPRPFDPTGGLARFLPCPGA